MIIYDETAETYHANPALGSSDIRAFIKSPRLFKDYQDGVTHPETPALLFGTVSHLRLLEPETFRSSVVIKPEDMSFSTKEGKVWRDAQAGKLIVSGKDAAHLWMMHERMPSEVHAAIKSSRREVTVRTEINGLACQCRVDAWSPSCLYDLKTVATIESIEPAVWKHGYHIQQRWYQRVVEAETGKRLPFRFLFAEKCPPYRWRVVELDPDYQGAADDAIDEALHGIVARTKSGCWDDPAELHLIASPPTWLSPDEDEE